MKIIILFSVLMFLINCTNESGSISALEDMGFNNIQLTGYSFGSCSDKDSTCTGFTAVNTKGRMVSGAVGCGLNWGWSKGCTVRFSH